MGPRAAAMTYVAHQHLVDGYGNPRGLPPSHPQQHAIDAAQAVLDSYAALPLGTARRDARDKLAALVRGIALSMLVTGDAPPLPEDGAMRRLLQVAVRQIRREVDASNYARRTASYRWADR
jgi:hypothetical protein